jgi:pyrimidine deaminase RibD-like protein
MRASDFEISNYYKLDKILSKLCEMVVKGQDSAKDYGMVAAAVVDPDNQIVARLNRPGDDGKRVHAEHAAMLDYTDKYGSIPKGSIIVTTLSPCNEHMDERDGPSCTELINNSTVKKVYCGYMDPTQDDDTRQFNLMETADKSLRTKCKQFADTFLDNVDETQSLEERRKKKRKTRRAAYGPGPYGWYGYDAGYSGSSSGGDGGGGESMKNENFADGKNPQDKGDAKRHGVNTKASVSSLRKTAKQGGRKGQLAHWMANMKAGRAKKK